MSADPNSDPETLLVLDIDDIEPNPRNPRLIFPQEELDKLIESIDREGILVSIVVYPKGNGKYVLVDGERRYKCALILGLKSIRAIVTQEKSEHDQLLQMFNIHQIREPWQDMPTAKALQLLAEQLRQDTGQDPSDDELVAKTGLSLERVRRFRYVVTLPQEWQDYIQEGRIPLNFFWELKRYVIEPLANQRPDLNQEFGAERVARAFVEKRLNNVITDTVSLRNVTPIIRYSAQATEENSPVRMQLNKSLRDLVEDPKATIDEAYENTVQLMVEIDKIERRAESMVAAFAQLLFKSTSDDDRQRVRSVANRLIDNLRTVVQEKSNTNG